ncbi:hypothetical protein CLNEO_22050 [Anaerotignum neopropionicum]|uniref:Uncharacterized protein n=1 Tax=Anaerotignum neopropionicum TaxID=36847 RepID=A0A136WDU5_9FIRM|nr:hypothetical protein CLNEO_22050 [Anaerotignum neopropionicum]
MGGTDVNAVIGDIPFNIILGIFHSNAIIAVRKNKREGMLELCWMNIIKSNGNKSSFSLWKNNQTGSMERAVLMLSKLDKSIFKKSSMFLVRLENKNPYEPSNIKVRRGWLIYSHSIVAGGFEVTSYTIRFTCFTSFTILTLTRSNTS